MKDSWTRYHDYLQFSLKARKADMVERPVPVVIVEVAKMVAACVYLAPHFPVQGHPHVVLRADPLGYLDLKMLLCGFEKFQIDVSEIF